MRLILLMIILDGPLGKARRYLFRNLDVFLVSMGLRKPLSPISNTNHKIKDLWNDNKTWNIPLISNVLSNCKDVEDINNRYHSYSKLNDKRI